MHSSWRKATQLGGRIITSFSQGNGDDFPWLGLSLAFPVLTKSWFGLRTTTSVGHIKAATAEGVCAGLTTHFFLKHSQEQDLEFWKWITKPSGISTVMNTQVYFDGGPQGLMAGGLGKALNQNQNTIGARGGTRTLMKKGGVKYYGGLPSSSARQKFSVGAFVNSVANESLAGESEVVYKRIGIFNKRGGHAIGSISCGAPKQYLFLDVNQGLVSFDRIGQNQGGLRAWLTEVATSYYDDIDEFYVDFYTHDRVVNVGGLFEAS